MPGGAGHWWCKCHNGKSHLIITWSLTSYMPYWHYLVRWSNHHLAFDVLILLYMFNIIDNYYVTLAIYWPCRCGCSIDWGQRSINETDQSILSLAHYTLFANNDETQMVCRLLFVVSANLFLVAGVLSMFCQWGGFLMKFKRNICRKNFHLNEWWINK